MNETIEKLKGTPFYLEDNVQYADGSVVSQTLLKKTTGNITLFAFDAGQGLSEHTAPFDAVVYILDGQARITIGGKDKCLSCRPMCLTPFMRRKDSRCCW